MLKYNERGARGDDDGADSAGSADVLDNQSIHINVVGNEPTHNHSGFEGQVYFVDEGDSPPPRRQQQQDDDELDFYGNADDVNEFVYAGDKKDDKARSWNERDQLDFSAKVLQSASEAASAHRLTVPGHRSAKKTRNSIGHSNGGYSDAIDRASTFSHVQREGQRDNPMISQIANLLNDVDGILGVNRRVEKGDAVSLGGGSAAKAGEDADK